MNTDSLEELTTAMRRFAAEREWDQFHTPKNLAMALTCEVGELLEHFQWLTAEESSALPPERLAAVRQELADVLLYLVRLSDRLGVDLAAAAREKLVLNAARYPVEKSRGRATRYDEL
jgi:dCTP diphosphatase